MEVYAVKVYDGRPVYSRFKDKQLICSPIQLNCHMFEREFENINVWIHEFTETTLQKTLSDFLKWRTIKIHLPWEDEEGKYISTLTIPHIMTSLHTNSGSVKRGGNHHSLSPNEFANRYLKN